MGSSSARPGAGLPTGSGSCSLAAPAHPGRCIGLARPEQLSQRGQALPLLPMTCRSAAGLFLLCVPAAAPLPPSQPCRLGMAAASASLPPPPSLPNVNRRHTQLSSLSLRAEPQMDFTGQRLLQHAVKHPRGCGRCPTALALPWGCSCAGRRCCTHLGVCWAVEMGSGWMDGCRPGTAWEPHTNPSSPWPLAWVQLTPFDQDGQASCARAKALIKYLAVN